MSVITVFNGLFCEAGVVVKRVLDSTGYRLVTDQEIVADAAELSGMNEEKIARAFQAKASVFNAFSHEKERAIAWLRYAMAKKLMGQDKILFSGLLLSLPARNRSYPQGLPYLRDERASGRGRAHRRLC